jgi:AbrB family looped-hinge helix DNA binding protein
VERRHVFGTARITVVIYKTMPIAYSKLTAQGQISVPAEVRRKLGIGPGSLLEWDAEDEKIVVRRAGRYTSQDVHRALFATTPRLTSCSSMPPGY